MEEKIDRRTRRTRSAIRIAFATLLTKKDISKITIRDIADYADINRATFYLHYSDVYDVLEDLENEVANNFFIILNQYETKQLLVDPYPLLKAIGEQIDSRPEFSKFVVESAPKSNYFAKIKAEIRKRLQEAYDTEIASQLYYALSYVSAGTLDVYAEWYESGRPVPLSTMCKWLSQLISGGISTILNRA